MTWVGLIFALLIVSCIILIGGAIFVIFYLDSSTRFKYMLVWVSAAIFLIGLNLSTFGVYTPYRFKKEFTKLHEWAKTRQGPAPDLEIESTFKYIPNSSNKGILCYECHKTCTGPVYSAGPDKECHIECVYDMLRDFCYGKTVKK